MDSLPNDVISYLLSFLDYDQNLFLVNKKINKMYHLSIKRYGANIRGLNIHFFIEIFDRDSGDIGESDESEDDCEDVSEYEDDIYIGFNEKFYSNYILVDRLRSIMTDAYDFCDGGDAGNLIVDLQYIIPSFDRDSYSINITSCNYF